VTLGTLLERAALRRPDAEAVVDGRRRLTYAELDSRATAAAQGFARLGVARGDRVLLALRNHLEHIVAYWALQKLSGGENIHPVEVEDVLARHAAVKDVAVIGEPDGKWGERVVAFVVPSGALTAETLDHHCRTSGDLASFKRPRRFVFVSEIPKTASGKILRRLLRDGHYTEVRP